MKNMVTISTDMSRALKLLEATAKKADKSMVNSVGHAAALVNRNAKDIVGEQRQLRQMPNGYFRWDSPSRPGDPPKRRTGKLQKSLRFEVEGKTARLFSQYTGTGKRKENGFIARFMEDGTYKMARRPFMQRAVRKSLSRIPVMMAVNLEKSLS